MINGKDAQEFNNHITSLLHDISKSDETKRVNEDIEIMLTKAENDLEHMDIEHEREQDQNVQVRMFSSRPRPKSSLKGNSEKRNGTQKSSRTAQVEDSETEEKDEYACPICERSIESKVILCSMCDLLMHPECEGVEDMAEDPHGYICQKCKILQEVDQHQDSKMAQSSQESYHEASDASHSPTNHVIDVRAKHQIKTTALAPDLTSDSNQTSSSPT